MSDEWLDNTYPVPNKTSEQEAALKKWHETKKAEEEKQNEAAEKNRSVMLPSDLGVVSCCPEHGRYFHEYSIATEKIMNREVRCPVCSTAVPVIGEYTVYIPPRWDENDY